VKQAWFLQRSSLSIKQLQGYFQATWNSKLRLKPDGNLAARAVIAANRTALRLTRLPNVAAGDWLPVWCGSGTAAWDQRQQAGWVCYQRATMNKSFGYAAMSFS